MNTIEARRDLSISYNKLGDISKAEGNLEEAKDWYIKDLEISKILAAEASTIDTLDDLAISYYKLGLLPIIPLQKRREYFEQLKSIGTELYQKTGQSRYELFIQTANKELEKLKN